MINILSYVGMNMQSEVCLWTLLGLVRTIFDATLFKVNANLKQVWQMSMPVELSMPVQRVLRTMISGIMLVQCFTVYVYLASYIVLLYPVFLEEHPALVLPWLLLAAIRKLLCELTSLAVGLGTCVLLGNTKPPCIKFLIIKICSIMPAFYMWLLVYSYYHALKVASAFKTFPVLLPPNDPDYGLELAVRRRRTKSLFTEEHLRKKLVAGFYAERSPSCKDAISPRVLDTTVLPANANDSGSSIDVLQANRETLQPLSGASHRYLDVGTYEDWFGKEIVIPRGDRILEQFITMLLRIGAYLNKDEGQSIKSQMFNSTISAVWTPCENIEAMSADATDTPPLVGNSRGRTASYLREYPQIFMKKLSSETPQPDVTVSQIQNTESVASSVKSHPRSESKQIALLESEKNISAKTLSLNSKNMSHNSVSNERGVPKSEKVEQYVNFSTENATKLVLPAPELTIQSTTSSYDSPHAFLLEIINNCFETVFNNINLLNSGEIQQNLINCIVSSEEILLPKQEVARQRRVSYEDSSKIGDESREIDASASSSKKSEGELKSVVLEDENRETATDGSSGTSNNQSYQRDISKKEDALSSSKKLKKD